GMAELLDPPFLNHMHAASGKAHESGSGSIGISCPPRDLLAGAPDGVLVHVDLPRAWSTMLTIPLGISTAA
ncbi:MAG: hypothetical protein ACRYF2_06930, partial [Janthinobacterium lividum]